MQIDSTHIIRLANHLEAVGLGGTRPIDAARALFDALRRQPGGDDAYHQTAHNHMVLQLVRRGNVAGLVDPSKPDAAMLILARLVYAGATDAEIAEALPGKAVGE